MIRLARFVGVEPPGDRRRVGRRARRVGLAVFFVSIAVNALLGIYALLAPGFGEVEGKLLMTSLCVTAAVLLVLACEPAWERWRLGLVPLGGAATAVIGFGLMIAGIWAEPSGEVFVRLMGTTLIVAVACALACLLALGRLAARFRSVYAVTLGVLALATVMTVAAVWMGEGPPEAYARALGVVLITLAALAVTVPVLHWLSRGEVALSTQPHDVVAYCPFCGGALEPSAAAFRSCIGCGNSFRVIPAPPGVGDEAAAVPTARQLTT